MTTDFDPPGTSGIRLRRWQARVSSGARSLRLRNVRPASLAVLLVLRLTANAAHAQTSDALSPTVDEQLQRGIELRKEGRDAEALQEFRAAYQRDRSPRVRAQIAVAEQALGHWVEAERGLMVVLGTTDDAWIEERRNALEHALARVRARLGSLIVQSNVSGAELWIDGTRAAVLPTVDPVRVVAGTHELEVTAAGFATAHRSVDVAGQGRVQERFVLTPLPASKPGGLSSPDTGTLVAPTTPLKLSRLTWASVGIFGGLLTAGGTALAVREINVAHYNDASRCVVGTASREERCGAYRDAANASEVVAIGAFSAAGLAALGLALSLTNDVMRARGDSVSLHCAPAAGGIGCGGRFW